MDFSDQNPTPPVSIDSTQALRLLTTLFDAHDLILFRPIETWTESGRKHSRIDYRNVCHRLARENVLVQTLDRLLASSADERTNLLFGVCPRLGDKGRFDFAWHIRTVRFLWADIDDCTVDESGDRCTGDRDAQGWERSPTVGHPRTSAFASHVGGSRNAEDRHSPSKQQQVR